MERFCKQNNQLPTKSHDDDLKDNSIRSLRSIEYSSLSPGNLTWTVGEKELFAHYCNLSFT